MPIANINTNRHLELIELVDKVLANGVDNSSDINEIDQLVYKLYDLTEDEIKIIEAATK